MTNTCLRSFRYPRALQETRPVTLTAVPDFCGGGCGPAQQGDASAGPALSHQGFEKLALPRNVFLQEKYVQSCKSVLPVGCGHVRGKPQRTVSN